MIVSLKPPKAVSDSFSRPTPAVSVSAPWKSCRRPTVQTFEGSAGAQRVEGIDLATLGRDVPTLSSAAPPTSSSQATSSAPTPRLWRPSTFACISGESNFRLEGQLEGDALSARVHSADEVLPIEATVDGDLVFSSGFGTPLSLPRLDVGEEVTIETFDPLSMAATESTVRCTSRQQLEVAGQVFDTRRLVVDSSGLKTLAWVDESGDVVRAETALGLILERVPSRETPAPDRKLRPCSEAGSAAAGAELLELTAIFPTGLTPHARCTLHDASRIGGDSAGRAICPTDTTQLRRRAAPLQSAAGRHRACRPPSPAAARRRCRSPTPSCSRSTRRSSPRPRRSSRDVGSDPPGARRAPLRPGSSNLSTRRRCSACPRRSKSSSMRKGDCNEHTVLYTALARASRPADAHRHRRRLERAPQRLLLPRVARGLARRSLALGRPDARAARSRRHSHQALQRRHPDLDAAAALSGSARDRGRRARAGNLAASSLLPLIFFSPLDLQLPRSLQRNSSCRTNP